MKKSIILLFILLSNIIFAKSVLIISSYHKEFEWTNLCLQGIEDQLKGKYDITIYFMDTKRISADKYQEKADLAWKEYQKLKPDLVMLGDDNALKFLGNKFGKTGTPIVYFGINDSPRKYLDEGYTNITGVLERTPTLQYYRILKKIMPTATKSLVLFENTTSSRIDASIFNGKESLWIDNLKVDHQVIYSWENWKSTIITSSNKYDFLLLVGYFGLKDKNGTAIKDTDVVKWTTKNSPVPIFTNHNYTVSDKGAVGAMVIHGYSHGNLAGTIALEILENNTIPNTILPKTDKNAQLYFNLKQLKEFNINLPAIYKKNAVFQ